MTLRTAIVPIPPVGDHRASANLRRRPLWPEHARACKLAPRPLRSPPAGHNAGVQIRIEGVDLPGSRCGPAPERPDGHHGIQVGVQRRNRPGELLGLAPGSAPSASWTLECKVSETERGIDVQGPYVQGPPGGRFVYLSWVCEDGAGQLAMFRRAKLCLDDVPSQVLARAAEDGVLVGRLGLTDPKGNPRCAAVRPPLIEWTAAVR
jgi:hypothetical protein